MPKKGQYTKYNIGDKYNKLTITSEGPKVESFNRRRVWCLCDCGNHKQILVQTNNLQSGNTYSCGCIKGTHKLSSSRIYQIHEGMLRRCNNSRHESYYNYGGRGIQVCKEWDSSKGGCFENFFNDMGYPPSDKHTLDRIDWDKGYYKENCRWATNSVQGYNKKLDPNNTSGKSGVSFYTSIGKWSAEIHVENKHIRLGMFDLFEDAVKAREQAELKYYGWNKQ